MFRNNIHYFALQGDSLVHARSKIFDIFAIRVLVGDNGQTRVDNHRRPEQYQSRP